jgi:hypothetical protein
MTEQKEPSGAEKMFGDFAPGLVHFTDDVLFGEAGSARSWRSATAAWPPSPPCSPAATPSS